MFWEAQEKFIEFFDDFSAIVSEAKRASFHEKRLKILTTKQIFQKLQIALAQVKASNTSENLLNEIRQIISTLYQANKICRKHTKIYRIQ